MLFFQALLSSKSDSVSQLESDVLRLEVLAQETSDQLSAREEQLRELAEKASEVSATANLVAGKETERDTLAAKKNLYYMVTRIVWEKVKRDDSKVNGFVLNPSKNEVSTFTVDRNEQGPIFLGCNLAENSLPILKQVGRQNVLYAVKSMKVTVFSVFHFHRRDRKSFTTLFHYDIDVRMRDRKHRNLEFSNKANSLYPASSQFFSSVYLLVFSEKLCAKNIPVLVSSGL